MLSPLSAKTRQWNLNNLTALVSSQQTAFWFFQIVTSGTSGTGIREERLSIRGSPFLEILCSIIWDPWFFHGYSGFPYNLESNPIMWFFLENDCLHFLINIFKFINIYVCSILLLSLGLLLYKNAMHTKSLQSWWKPHIMKKLSMDFQTFLHQKNLVSLNSILNGLLRVPLYISCSFDSPFYIFLILLYCETSQKISFFYLIFSFFFSNSFLNLCFLCWVFLTW